MENFFTKRYDAALFLGRKTGDKHGRVAERLKALVLKTSNGKLFVGSNPTSSANRIRASLDLKVLLYKTTKRTSDTAINHGHYHDSSPAGHKTCRIKLKSEMEKYR